MSELFLDKNDIYISKTSNDGEVSYPDIGNKACFGIERNSFWFNHRNNILEYLLNKYPHQGNFADIGGGNGFQASFIEQNFPKNKIFLIEPGYDGCLNAKQYGVKNVYNIPFQEFDFSKNEIGGIGLFDVIEHIGNDVEFLKQIAAKCLPGTLIYITVPAYNWLWSDQDDFAGHFRRYNSKMIKSLAQQTNLKLIYNGYFLFYLPLLTFIARSLPYKLRGKRDDKIILAEAINNLSPSLIAKIIFNFLSKIELYLIKFFGKLITGGSCLAVFQIK